MKRAARNGIGRDLQVTLVTMICALLMATGAYGQGSSGSPKWPIPCMVNYLRLRIATGGDDLRGWDGMSSSKDNLNVTVDFGAQGSQLASNVNNNAEWANNSVHLVEIKFNRPVPLNNIRGIELQHTGSDLGIDGAKASTPAGPAAGIQTADNWNMQWLELMAFDGGGQALILHYGAHRFTGSDRTLRLPADIPANSCEVSERFGRLNPASKTVQNVSGTGSKYGKEQLAPSTIQPAPKASAQQLQNNRLIQQALAHTVQIGPRANAPGGDGGYSSLIGLLRKQSAAARSLLLPAFTGGVKPASAPATAAKGATLATAPSQSGPMLNGSGGTNQASTLLNPRTTRGLNPQPYPPKGSTPQVGASQTMSAPGNASPTTTAASSNPSGNTTNFNLAPQSNSLTPTNGPTAQHGPGQHPTPTIGAREPMPTQICKTGIATVDGGVNGVWFSPVAGQDGQFVIQGCGFGAAPGEVYLSGVQYDPAHAKLKVQYLGVSNSLDRVYFQTPPNNWSDRQIVAQIDANASGLYDTNNVTLNVKAAGGQIYQATGMNFLAARQDQVLQPLVRTPQPGAPDACYGLTLAECLIPGMNLAVVNSSVGPLKPQVESPTSGDWLKPAGQSIAVVRGVIYLNPTDNYSVSFPSGTDTYQFNFAPGFQFDPNKPVLLNHASMDVPHCESLGGVYLNSGNWSVSYMSASSFQVHWEEESCSPGSAMAKNNPAAIGNAAGFTGLSTYQLQITVIGPRGVSPLASGKVNPLAIKQIQPVQMLKKN